MMKFYDLAKACVREIAAGAIASRTRASGAVGRQRFRSPCDADRAWDLFRYPTRGSAQTMGRLQRKFPANCARRIFARARPEENREQKRRTVFQCAEVAKRV